MRFSMTNIFSDNFNQKQSLEILVNVIEKGYLGLRQEEEMRGDGSVAAVSIADPTVLIVAPPR